MLWAYQRQILTYNYTWLDDLGGVPESTEEFELNREEQEEDDDGWEDWKALESIRFS
jgi:hypothetical protein